MLCALIVSVTLEPSFSGAVSYVLELTECHTAATTCIACRIFSFSYFSPICQQLHSAQVLLCI